VVELCVTCEDAIHGCGHTPWTQSNVGEPSRGSHLFSPPSAASPSAPCASSQRTRQRGRPHLPNGIHPCFVSSATCTRASARRRPYLPTATPPASRPPCQSRSRPPCPRPWLLRAPRLTRLPCMLTRVGVMARRWVGMCIRSKAIYSMSPQPPAHLRRSAGRGCQSNLQSECGSWLK